MRLQGKFQRRALLTALTLALIMFVIGGWSAFQKPVRARRTADAYDISEWQGRINGHQTRQLKNEVSFLILRAQNGSAYQDRTFNHNVNQLTRAQIPYGVYSFSLYRNSSSARREARALYQRAPAAQFYVNDAEINYAGRRSNHDARVWADEMKSLTTRPVVLYSYASFINRHLNRARKDYNAIWLAGYTHRQPLTRFKYGMWQFSDNYYSRALGKRLDASRLMDKPLTFWLNQSGRPVTKSNQSSQKTKGKRSKIVLRSDDVITVPGRRTSYRKRTRRAWRLRISRADHASLKRASRHWCHGRRLTRHEWKLVRRYHVRL